MESCQCFGATQLQHSSNTSKNIPSFLAMQQEYMKMQPPSKLHHGYPINMCDQNQDLYQISYAIITMRENLNTIERVKNLIFFYFFIYKSHHSKPGHGLSFALD